jgi:hypothetical protein
LYIQKRTLAASGKRALNAGDDTVGVIEGARTAKHKPGSGGEMSDRHSDRLAKQAPFLLLAALAFALIATA